MPVEQELHQLRVLLHDGNVQARLPGKQTVVPVPALLAPGRSPPGVEVVGVGDADGAQAGVRVDVEPVHDALARVLEPLEEADVHRRLADRAGGEGALRQRIRRCLPGPSLFGLRVGGRRCALAFKDGEEALLVHDGLGEGDDGVGELRQHRRRDQGRRASAGREHAEQVCDEAGYG